MPASIIIPYVRYEGMVRCVDSIIENAGFSDYEIVVEEDKDRIGVANMVHKLLQKCKFDLIMFLADDTEIEKNCIYYAVNEMKKFEDEIGMVGLNDETNIGRPTHFMINKKILPFIGGYIFNPVYTHCFADDEIFCRVSELNKYRFCKEAKIIHHHPFLNKSVKMDEFYNSVYNKSRYLKDQTTFRRRKENNWN